MCVPLSFVHMPVHTHTQLPFLCCYDLVFLALSLLLFISCLSFLSLVFLCLVFVFSSLVLSSLSVSCLSMSYLCLSITPGSVLTFSPCFYCFLSLVFVFPSIVMSFSVHLSRTCSCKQEQVRASTIIFCWHTLSRTNFFLTNIFKFLTQVAHTTLSNTFQSTLYVSLCLFVRGCFFFSLFLSFSTSEVVWLVALHLFLIRCIISFSLTHACTHTLQKYNDSAHRLIHTFSITNSAHWYTCSLKRI